MRSAPIVISSSLDQLYRQLPVVIVSDWRQVFEAGALERFKAELEARFGGPEPFEAPGVLRLLSAQYWVHHAIKYIKNASAPRMFYALGTRYGLTFRLPKRTYLRQRWASMLYAPPLP